MSSTFETSSGDHIEANAFAARLGTEAGRTITTSRWTFDSARTQRWRDFALWIVESGRGTFYGDGLEIPLTRGSCLLLAGQRDYLIIRDAVAGLDHFYLHFDYLDEDGAPIPLSRFDRLPRIFRQFDDYPFVRGLILRTLAHSSPPAQHQIADCWLNAILAEVAQQDCHPPMPGPERERAEALQELCLAIRNHPEQRHAVADMAKQMNCTPSHFCRIFKAQVGCSPQQFVLDARMTAARHLLRDSGHSITHIADVLGYRDVFFFSRQFTQHHGVTPSDYRSHAGVAVLSDDTNR